jgi:uncharacterized protein (DUF58 family)
MSSTACRYPRAGQNPSTLSSEPLLTLSDIAEIELCILKRMKEFTLGDHASIFKGAGFNFVGIRDWEPGDRLSSIDWAQSSLTNFSPLITREFEQDSTATILALADASLSTRCGVDRTPIASAVARAIAAVGLSSVLGQDQFGLITFDENLRQFGEARPRIGKPHVLYCIDLYQHRRETETVGERPHIRTAIARHLRKPSLVPVISDFLFDGAPALIRELAHVNAKHDVVLLLVDARFAYRLGDVSAGWVRTFDVETGATRVVSRREFKRLAERVEEWQQSVQREARDAGIDTVVVGLDRWDMETALAAFLAERRLRRK